MEADDFWILDAEGKLEGIISKTDLVQAVQVRMVGDALERTSRKSNSPFSQ